jgi:hypothetical protein
MENLLAQCLAAGTHTVPTPTMALRNLEAGRSVLRTGVAALDRVLRGGFPCRSLRYRRAGMTGCLFLREPHAVCACCAKT